MKGKKNYGINLLCVLFWIAAWEAVSLFIGKDLLFPSPVSVFGILASNVFEPVFWFSVLHSLGRVAMGFIFAVFAGTVLGAVMSVSRPVEYIFSPIITVIKSTPVASFIILVLLWVKSSDVPILISFLMVLPIISGNIFSAIKGTDIKLLEMAKVYNFSFAKKVKLIYIPQCLPNFYTACVMGIGFAWKSSIAAEVIANPAFSIGRGLYNSKTYLETPQLFAWTLVVIVLSLLLENLFKKFMQGVFRAEGRKWLN